MQLHQFLNTQKLTGSVAVISFAPVERIRQWRELALFAEAPPELFAHTRFLCDSSLQAYHAYGLGRYTWLQVMGLRVMLYYMKRSFQGHPAPRPAQDPLQRGGDFVVDIAGRITLSYVGKDQVDRPMPSCIAAAMQASAGS